MSWKSSRSVDRLNRQISNIFSSRGKLENISSFIFNCGIPVHFVVSGGVEAYDRYRSVYPILDVFVGQMPVIVLHKGNIHIESLVSESWRNVCANLTDSVPLWICNEKNACFEPFLNMNEMQIVNCCRLLATKLNYTVSPRFERVVRAHLSILKVLDIPFSLSGLYYLCKFHDMGEFYDNIMALPCDESFNRRIWADLGADDESGNAQFDLFRAVINNLAHDAEISGWNTDNTVYESNCLSAIANNAVFTLPVNELYSPLILTYLSVELSMLGNKPFLLLIDEVKINDNNFLEFISSSTYENSIGVISENVVDQIGPDEATFLRFAERINCFVLFKHSIGKTAEILSQVFGKFEYTKIESSQGVSRGFFQFMPRDRHEDMRFSVEDRYRVMPEEFIGLKAGQAIIFDTKSDQIIHYN